MQNKIEKVLNKFGLKGISYDPCSGGGKALVSAEEQLAAVGLCWSKSPVGWLVLFVEGLKDRHAYKMLSIATRAEALRLMTEQWRGCYPDQALISLTESAISEAIQSYGQLCIECGGTAIVIDKHRSRRKCPCCKGGRIEWTTEVRFAYFCRSFPIPLSRFKKYDRILSLLVDWLQANRTAACLAINEQMELEEKEALKYE